jgi:hypothetical protein
VPHQEALTLLAPVDPDRVGSLTQLMKDLALDPGHNAVLPFGEVKGCHFGRVLFMPSSVDLKGNTIAPQLLVLSDCDGSADEHLRAIVDRAGPGIDTLFGHCEGYPDLRKANGSAQRERLAFLKGKQQNIKANYVHRQGRTVEQVRNEAKLREALQAFIGKHGLANLPALEARKQLRAHVRSTPSLAWAAEPAEGVDLGYKVKNALHFTTLPLGLVAFGGVVLPALALLLLLIRMQEARDYTEGLRPTPEQVKELVALEDFFAHNGFTAGGYVKPGLLRQVVVHSVLPLIGWGTRHLFTEDSLAGVKSIHFARWIPLDGGRRVVFCSNFDGSMESYNNDFIDLVGWGLNLIFSNGYGYPRTSWLVSGGASHEQEFKDYLRRHQIPTPVWYSAYPQLTAANVVRNAKLRAGLSGFMTEREAQQWLKLF